MHFGMYFVRRGRVKRPTSRMAPTVEHKTDLEFIRSPTLTVTFLCPWYFVVGHMFHASVLGRFSGVNSLICWGNSYYCITNGRLQDEMKEGMNN